MRQQGFECERLAGCAEATLQRVVRDNRFLYGIKLAIGAAQSLDGRNRMPLAFDCKRQAAIDRLAIHQHGAGATLAHVAARLGARQREVVAERIEQRAAGFNS